MQRCVLRFPNLKDATKVKDKLPHQFQLGPKENQLPCLQAITTMNCGKALCCFQYFVF